MEGFISAVLSLVWLRIRFKKAVEGFISAVLSLVWLRIRFKKAGQ